MLVNPKQMVLDAQRGQYAIGCFNTSDLEMTKAIIAAAENLRSPIIISTSEKAIAYAGLQTLAALIKEEAKRIHAPVALHLDHGSSINLLKDCLEAGYTSLMYDGSRLVFEENVEKTYEAVKLSHEYKVPCEGELGAMGKTERELKLTNPAEVGNFVKKTGVDFLAVSIGSKHGMGTDEPLDIDLLCSIRKATNIPLVLHGGSGVKDNEIKKVIEYGICKINIDTDIRHTFTEAMRDITTESPEIKDSRKVLSQVMARIQKLVEEKIKLFGSDGKK